VFQVGSRAALPSVLAAGVFAVTVVQAVPAEATSRPSSPRHTGPSNHGAPTLEATQVNAHGRALAEAQAVVTALRNGSHSGNMQQDGFTEAEWTPGASGSSEVARRLAALAPGQELVALGANEAKGYVALFAVAPGENGEPNFAPQDAPHVWHPESYLRGHHLGYGRIFTKAIPAKFGSTTPLGPNALRILAHLDSWEAKSQAAVFRYLSQRPGEYLSPVDVGAALQLGKDRSKASGSASYSMNKLAGRELIKVEIKSDERWPRYAGKTDGELSAISLDESSRKPAQIDGSGLGVNARIIHSKLSDKAAAQKDAFAFLSYNPQQSYTVAQLAEEIERDTHTTGRALGILEEMKVVTKGGLAEYGPGRAYRARNEAELASVLAQGIRRGDPADH